tara:strand:+ start:624 stop:989 length:366 start_codon:yes stop_codon:yes gene_type:complete
MDQKKLEKGSAWESADLNNDGVVSDGELAMAERMEKLQHRIDMNENLDRMMDQQRWICWVSSISSIVLILIALLPIIPDNKIEMITALLSTYIIANLGIVSVFMGATAYSKKNGQSKSTEK